MESKPTPDRQLQTTFSALVRVQIDLWNSIDQAVRGSLDLTVARLEVMRSIANRVDCRVGEIADDLGVTVGGASKVVDRIEAAGHCVRKVDPRDRRSSHIALTPAGHAVLDLAEERVESVLSERLLRPLGREGVARLARDLAALKASGAAQDAEVSA